MIFTIKEKIRFFGETVASSYTLNEIQRNEIIRATQFRANIIGASTINSSPIPISVSTFDIPNANALSYDFFSNPIFNRVLQGESIDTIRQELIGVSEDFFTKASVEYLGHINMGKLDWYIAFSSYYPT
ncbi:hypothetical protein FX927_01280 [Campylobacter coli]|nr:hypothetical protein [Campylobacter coli]EAI4896586.1 hypothetical protein [Campylobacter coli]ECL0961200.1 hypothetical protein [Campylobacter coli]ECL1806389.1 hypothetical protein [Campylobacter coli]ECL2465424.1 hypothetical protein [Campylobacter coli]